MKFKTTSYTNHTEILAFAKGDEITVAAMMGDADVAANSDGKKIVPAGTFVGGVSASDFADRTQKLHAITIGASAITGAAVCDGILLDDVDVTYGAAPCSLLIHGYVKTSKLPAAPTSVLRTAMSPNCFIGYIAD